ncbi:ferredoxin [Actinomadura rugatobispora]|uniref:Ferredoxin n=1 Tax=Actinomadura rugatobispora TaxID=1994 RepID=A0ABW1A163_9ACTN|nr:ferredoxin [Actinomadura rugatobispora]
MRVTVDRTRCQGHALCVMNAPDLFDLDDEGRAGVLADPVPRDLGTAAREATGGCPEQAIAIEPRTEETRA